MPSVSPQQPLSSPRWGGDVACSASLPEQPFGQPSRRSSRRRSFAASERASSAYGDRASSAFGDTDAELVAVGVGADEGAGAPRAAAVPLAQRKSAADPALDALLDQYLEHMRGVSGGDRSSQDDGDPPPHNTAPAEYWSGSTPPRGAAAEHAERRAGQRAGGARGAASLQGEGDNDSCARNASTAPGRVRWAEAIEARRRSSVDSSQEGGWGYHAAGEGKDERRGSDSPYCEDRSSRYDDASDDASETRWVAVATGR